MSSERLLQIIGPSAIAAFGAAVGAATGWWACAAFAAVFVVATTVYVVRERRGE